jgi:hypothetical protein
VLDRLRSLVRAGRYRLTLHAEEERDTEQITIQEIEEALTSLTAEIVEDYPNDPRGHSALVLGFMKSGKPLHLVCSIHEETAIVVTVYRPDPGLWRNWRTRKGTQP